LGNQIIYPTDLAANNPTHLSFDPQHSYYTSENKLNNLNDFSDIMAYTHEPMFYYANIQTYYYNHLYNSYSELVIAVDNVTVQWEITDETQVIDGYYCIKAVGKLRSVYAKEDVYYYEAWFAPELPYAYGPYKFSGLPGLVVYGIERNSTIYKLEKINFNVSTQIENFSLTPAKEIPIQKIDEKYLEEYEMYKKY